MSSLFGQKQSPPPQLCWFISSEIFLTKIIFGYQWHTQGQLTFSWHWVWRAAERTILSQLCALWSFGVPTYAQSPMGFKQLRTAKATTGLWNFLSAGDCPPLPEEGRSALSHQRLQAPTVVSTCSSDITSLCLWNPALFWGGMGRLSENMARITPSFRCTKHLATRNWPYVCTLVATGGFPGWELLAWHPGTRLSPY